jgi:hypothetical protein
MILGDKPLIFEVVLSQEYLCRRGLQGVDGDEDELLLLSTPSLEPVPTFTLEVEAPHAITSFTVAVETSRVEGSLSLSRVLPLTFRRHIHLNKS